MVDNDKTNTPPTSTGSAPMIVEKPTERKRNQRPSQTSGNRSKGKQTPDHNALKFDALRALTNLPDGGKFFLIFENETGQKETINCWG